MGVAETVRQSEAVLKRMTEDSEVILMSLNPEERVRVVSVLDALDREAAGVRSEADLLYVANTVRRLVERTPPLATLLLPQDSYAMGTRDPRIRRKVTRAQHEAAQRESPYAQKRAAQIRNHVVECRQSLERALQETYERSRD